MRRNAVHLRTRGLVCVLAVAWMGGCGGPAAPPREYADVTGKVTYQGAPLKMGQVIFQPSEGEAATGEIGGDGTYSLKGVVGQNTVMIVSREEQGPISADNPKSREPPKSHIPEAYATPAGGLKFEVKPGDNTGADFDLK